MTELKKINSASGAYALNSHGTGGTVDTKKNPAHFYIGNDMVTSNTDFSILKYGLEGRQVFIGACNVGTLYGNGYELVENMSKQTLSTVIAPDHPLLSGYIYDGSNYLNQPKVVFPFPAIEQNGYIISSRGSMFDQIRNVTIDKTKGLSWDVEPQMPFYLNPVVSNIYSPWY